MSSSAQLLSEVSRLVGALPGVTVTGGHISGYVATLEIYTLSASSALVVQRLCEAANVSFDPNIRPHEPELCEDAARVLTASTEGSNTIEHGCLQLLAIHLVWHLHGNGVIQAQAANELLSMWHGARIGA